MVDFRLDDHWYMLLAAILLESWRTKMPNCRHTLFLLCAVCLLFAASCGSDGTAPPVSDDDLGAPGDACEARRDCQQNLHCTDGRCAFGGNFSEGTSCDYTAECGDGLFCDTRLAQDEEAGIPPDRGTCQNAGAGEEGALCGHSADCESGLVCDPKGFSGICTEPGSGLLDESCEKTIDCYAGLSCAESEIGEGKTCSSGASGLPQFFAGVSCDREDDGPFRSYFEAADRGEADFFRLPYPNDIRLHNGRPDLSGFPTPGDDLLGFDIVERYIDAIEDGQQGFGLKPVIYFRFSDLLDFDTLNARGDDQTLRFVDISPDSERYNRQPSLSWSYNSGSQRYICQNRLSVTTAWGQPLQANTTYAVLLTGDIRSSDGDRLVRDDDFELVMADQRPDGLGAEWDAYQPLRDWAEDQEDVNPDDIVTAAVFTTGDPRNQVQALREPARSATPQLSDLTRCDDQADSVCGCAGDHSDFSELQGTLSLPVFQQGTAPYLESGGDVMQSVERIEEVCTSLTVPNSEMPDAGWPLLITAHGTGGDFRSHVEQITPLVNEMTWEDAPTAMIVLGWDQVLHASRRGESQMNPEPLVYNYANPIGARGNFLQSAADLFAIVAWAETFELSAEESPTGEAIRIDPDQIHVMGHSQGGTTAAIALAYEPVIRAALLSGAGSGLSYALLEKTSPNDALQGMQFALQDPTVSSPNHPVISLIQDYFDSVDPHSHAPFIVDQQIDGTYPHHVFQTYGVGDTYTPPRTMELLARGMYLDHAGSFVEELSGVDSVSSPLSGNRTVDGSLYTAALRQYAPGDDDGHFVVFRNEDAGEDLRRFFGSAILDEDGVPTVGR